MTPKNKVARAIETSPNIRSQICSKNRWNKFLFLLSSSNGILSVNRVHHGVETKIAETNSEQTGDWQKIELKRGLN
jgi:hypothetical protein